jgi:DNA replication protein DnaC
MHYCQSCAAAEAERELVEWRDRALINALRAAGATERLSRQSLGTFPRDEHGVQALAVATRWLDEYAAGARRNLWLVGPNGRGKSGLAWSIVRELVEQSVRRFFELDDELRGAEPAAPALFVIWRDLLADYRASFSSDAEFPLIERVRTVRVLALDELGGERPTEFAREQLATLVEHRYQRELPTIVTTNYSRGELAARLGHDDPIVGRRIVDRLAESAHGARIDGPNRRATE